MWVLILSPKALIKTSYWEVAGKNTTDRLKEPKWADVSSDSAECGTSVLEKYTTLSTSISSLLAFVSCSLGCLFLTEYCRKNIGTSVRFVTVQAVNSYVFVSQVLIQFYPITCFKEQSFTHILMAFTSHARVWRAAPEEETLPAKLPVLNITVLSSRKKNSSL